MSDSLILLFFLVVTITIIVLFVLAIKEAWKNTKKKAQDELEWGQKNKNNNKNEPTLLQILRKKFNNNKIFNYLGIASVVLGIIGWFIFGIIIGIITLIIASAAKKEKQGFAILGIILGIVDICGAVLLPLVKSGLSNQSIAQIITAGIVGAFWAIISNNQIKEAERKYQKRQKTK